MLKLPVHRIIPFSNVEGLGNRTSIFVQGCNANCLYCHNSETIPKHFDSVPMYSVETMVQEIKKSMPFIRGITVSGGEATLYHKFLTELFGQVHELGLTCYVDTNGFYEHKQIQELIKVTDKFLFDIKGTEEGLKKLCFTEDLVEKDSIDPTFSHRFGDGGEHLTNLLSLLVMDKVEEVRLVYLKGYYDAEAVISDIAAALKGYPHVPLKLIRVHGRGLPKERAVQLKGAIPSIKEVDTLADFAREAGIDQVITIK